MTIMLTGAAGFIGQNFALGSWRRSDLYPRGLAKTLVCVDKVSHPPETLDQLIYMKVDLTSVNEVAELFQQVQPETIVHLAGISRVGEKSDDNKIILHNLFTAARSLRKRPHFVIAGSAAEYGELALDAPLPKEGASLKPVDPYAHSKVVCYVIAQEWAEKERFPIAWVRFANVYGPLQDPDKLYHFVPFVIDTVYRGRVLPLNGKGLPRRQFVYVQDIVRALWQIVQTGMSGVYNLGGHEISMGEAAHVIVTAVHDYMLREGHMPTPVVFDLRSEGGGAKRVGVDSTKALSELGWSPTIDIYKGMRLTVASRLQGEIKDESRTPVVA